MNNFFQVGGSLPGNHPGYVERDADRELYQKLKAGEFCYVLSSRQMGKSSLRIHTRERLQAEGILCADIDLTGIGGQQTTPSQWYRDIIKELISSFGIKLDRRSWWQAHEDLSAVNRLHLFLEEVLLRQRREQLVIFLDEIDSILSLNFASDDFFALIRACYNRRADRTAYQRLTFAIFGVTTPDNLITAYERTPFNIGSAIDLQGFTLAEVQPLIVGLQDIVSDPEALVREVLAWTHGQPFLTQKLCKLITKATAEERASKDLVTQIVREKIINNWESQDLPTHLKTIRERILKNQQFATRLLGIYQQILLRGSSVSDGSPEETELLLSGLVSKRQGKLVVANPIYREIFTRDFVAQSLETLRPSFYSAALNQWLQSQQNQKFLLRGQKLARAKTWAENKKLTDEDYQFLNQSENQRGNRWKIVTIIGGSLASLTILYVSLNWYRQFRECPIGQVKLETKGACIIRVTSGENIFFREENNIYMKRGVAAFRESNYAAALEHFQRAVESSIKNPEPEIFRNNAAARLREANLGIEPLTITVVMPLDNQIDFARSMLRGIADSQTQFNQAQSQFRERPLLEVIVANDGNEPHVAAQIAQQLGKNKHILAVIGHNSSNATKAALPFYEGAGLTIITPTSTSTELDAPASPVFFRVPPSDLVAGQQLADYAKSQHWQKVAILYDSNSSYSRSLKEAFENQFGKQKNEIDLQKFHDWETEIPQLLAEKKVQALALFPSATTIAIARTVARANATLNEPSLPLLGGDTLYSAEILRQDEDGAAFEGLTISVPWLDRQTPYAKKAERRWRGGIGWRQAMSFDATQTLTKIFANLSVPPTRQSVREAFQTIRLSAAETSGAELRFCTNTNVNCPRGESNREPRLVRVVKQGEHRWQFQPVP